MAKNEWYFISQHEPGLGWHYLTGLERNGAGGILACWDTDETRGLQFSSYKEALTYITPIIKAAMKKANEEKHSSLKNIQIVETKSTDAICDSIDKEFHYHQAMKVI